MMTADLRLRWTSSGLVLPWVAAALLWLVAPARAEVTILESDDRHAVVEVTLPAPAVTPMAGAGRAWIRLEIPGLGHTEEIGRPEVPMGGFRVALPPGTTPRLRVLREDWSAPEVGALVPVARRVGISEPFGVDRVVEETPVEGEDYRRSPVYPETAFRITGTKGLRDLRVAEVAYSAARAIVSSDRHQVLRSAVLEILFDVDPRRERSAVTRPAPRTEVWDRTARSAVLNRDQAAQWARGGPGDATSVGDAPWGAGDQWKVEVDVSGLAEVTYATLAAAGFPPGVPIGQVSIYQRTFDLNAVESPAVPAADLFVPLYVPALARDRNGNGTFDAGDGLLFWGRSVRDQWMTSGWEYEDLFDTRNFVWVRIDPAGGARMATRAGAVPTAPTTLLTTPSSLHREADLQYTQYPPDFGPGRQAFESEFYYWNSHRTPTDGDVGWATSDLFMVEDLAPGTGATFTGRVCPAGSPGAVTGYANFTNVVTFGVNGTQVGGRQFYNANLFTGGVVPPDAVLNTYPVPSGILTEGTNTFNFLGKSYQGGGLSLPAYSARFLFDWYEVTYQRRLVARNGKLELTTADGGSGPVTVNVTGFTGADLLLFDLTDAAAPVQVTLASGQITAGPGGTSDLHFEHDNATGVGRYLASREAAARTVVAGEVTRVRQASLLAGGVGAKWVAVSPAEFMTGARDLADYRAQRLSATVADLSEVWDVFHNGSRNPDAIKSFAAYAYHRWADPLVFLLLVGDASEDHRGIGPDSQPDFLPSHSLWTEYEGAPEETDQYYAEVTSDGLGTFDDLSDLYVGRLSVGTLEEMQWNVTRIRVYETENADQLWRRKVLLLGDDALSGDFGGSVSAGYGWNGGLEKDFCRKSHEYAESMAAHPVDDIVPDVLCLSDYTHPCQPDSCNAYRGLPGSQYYPANCEQLFGWDCGIWYDCRIDPQHWATEYPCVVRAVADVVAPVLRQKLNAGVMVWNYEGHANKFQLAHEYIFRDDSFDTRRDVLGLRNVDRPFLFLGFACHLAEFDRSDERVSEDCLAEKLMNTHAPDQARPAGCVGAFCSSGFEFLTENLSFNQYVLDAFFYPETAVPGAALPDDGSPGYVWTLGESTTRARLRYQGDFPTPSRSRQAAQRFILLGDPALSPDLGSPTIAARVNGVAVQNPADPYFVTPDDAGSSLVVQVTASDGRGITATRVVDTAHGELPTTDYDVHVDTATADGVPQIVTITHTVQLRAGELYDLRYQAVDASGKTSTFVVSTDTRFDFLDPPAVFPNPFADRTDIVFKTTGTVRAGKLDLFTIGGRKIRTVHVGNLTSNAQHAIEWDGRDDNGLSVANGTYLARISLTSVVGTITETLPIVRIR